MILEEIINASGGLRVPRHGIKNPDADISKLRALKGGEQS